MKNSKTPKKSLCILLPFVLITIILSVIYAAASKPASASPRTTADKETIQTVSHRHEFIDTDDCVYQGDLNLENYSVGIYSGTKEAQEITDRKNSAYIGKIYGITYIADHRTQGFDVLYDAVPGKTLAHVTWADKTHTTYICTNRIKGHNTERDLTDINFRPLSQICSADLVMYTAYDHWSNIIITYWDVY